ncbi:IclR family transcriptional regulator [Affinirhizobium pseudoryzae]|uniref:IclR family transcriptional regulator n=1 Tax=Allorhizobium pseudoryzae TaxID=379684 RepID=UPI0013EB2010|nr:IclR family transcriptional regulator [Allorhizobium pseudoryzae]
MTKRRETPADTADDPKPAEQVASAAETGTLGKAIALVELVCSAQQPLRFSDILRLTDQPRGSLHRQLRHLVLEGLLDLSPDGTYTGGLRLLSFASQVWARNSARKIAEPHLRRLQELTGETVHFGVLRGTDIIYLDKLESRQAVRMHSQVGNASPVYCTGIGKAALSTLEDDKLQRMAEAIRFVRFTPQTLTDPKILLAEIGTIRVQGFAFDREEHQAGIRCVAASVCAASRGFVGGISVTAPAFRAQEEQMQEWVRPLCSIAASIEAELDVALAPR